MMGRPFLPLLMAGGMVMVDELSVTTMVVEKVGVVYIEKKEDVWMKD